MFNLYSTKNSVFFEIELSKMLASRLPRISNHFKRNNNFFRKTKILLTSKNFVILNQAFLCGTNESPNNTVTVFKGRESFTEIYYRQYLLNSSEYADLIFHEGIQTNSKTAEILNQLHQEGEDNSNLRDQLFDHLDKVNQLSFIELCEVTFLVTKFVGKNNSDPLWDKILESINKECLTRMTSWTVDELIKMMYISIMLQKHLKFKSKLLYKLIQKSSSSKQIVSLFYFILKKKFLISNESLFDLEKKVIKILPEINAIETGIIAEGFCGSFKSLKLNDVFYNVLKKGLEAETLEIVPFHSFCKFAQVLSNFSNSKGIIEFQTNALKIALKLDVKAVVQLALTGEKVRYLDSNLRTILMKEVKDHIKELPAFYIERVAYLTTLFNIQDEEFLKLAVDIFETDKRKSKLFILFFLNHLIHHNMYPKNLINLVLEQEFVEKVIDYGIKYAHAWWYMYCSLDIEKPEYLTFDLAPKIRMKIFKLSKINVHLLYKRSHYYSWQLESILTKLFGEGTVKYMAPLPHCSFGLLMRFDKNLKPKKFPEELETNKKSFIIKPLVDDHIWMFISWVNYLHFTDVSNSITNLVFQTQLRQLNALGYTALHVNVHFHKIGLINEQKILDYFENLIKAKLEECCKNQKGAVTN